VDVFKGFKRESAKGPLRDFREQGIANLLKTICHNPRTTIRNRQTKCAKRNFWQTTAYEIINGPRLENGSEYCYEFASHQR
jgi:hypothetical protein